MESNCRLCGKPFKPKTRKKYCSKYCQLRYWNLNPPHVFTCQQCGKEFRVVRRLNAKGQLRKFCSTKCSNRSTNEARRSKRIFNTGGYVFLWCDGHPKAQGGRVAEHVLVAEKMLGRYLKDDEKVHHINTIRDDNRPENLFVASCQSEHAFIGKMTRWLIQRFIKEKGMEEDVRDYIDRNFFSKYNVDDYVDCRGLEARSIYARYFSEARI